MGKNKLNFNIFYKLFEVILYIIVKNVKYVEWDWFCGFKKNKKMMWLLIGFVIKRV